MGITHCELTRAIRNTFFQEENMPHLGPTELILILVIVIIVFGVGKLADIGGALGRGIREFRKATQGEDEVKKDDTKPVEAKSAEAKKA
jgi:sec-independent protein translocase protein TatA